MAEMEFTTLGRTGLKVSVAGLGCGGGSRLGAKQGKGDDHAIRLIHQAADLGVNFFDTAKAYGTEAVVGKAIQSMSRDDIVISTKSQIAKDGEMLTADDIVAALDESLADLQTEYVDIFHLHSLTVKNYAYATQELLPALLKEKAKGKIRFMGATEFGPGDHSHDMFSNALEDDFFDVIMLAYNMMHQNAETKIFPRTKAQGVGTLIMFAVRSVFSVPGRLQKDVRELVDEGKLPEWLAKEENPLSFLIHENGAESVIDAAYRYVRHNQGTDVILFGTGDFDHLKTNLASILKPSLPTVDVQRMQELFSHLEGFGLDLPGGKKVKEKN